MKFEGIYPPVVTPFNADYTINIDRFAQTVDFLIDSGVHGIIVGGTTGEYYAQSAEERVELMKLAKDFINGRVPLIVGTGAIRTEDSVYFAQQAKSAGADGLLVATPPYACPTGREIAMHALAVDEAANLPVILYNYPGRMSVSMDETTLDMLRNNSNFCAIKESSGSPDRLHLLAVDYPHIQVSCGMDDQALEFFAWGATSWVCAGGNFAPEAHIALFRTCVLEGNFDKGRQIMSAMMPLMRVLEQGGKFIQCIKYGMTLRGLDCGPPRKPMQPLDEDEKSHLSDVIREMNSTIDRLN
ncbi:MAG: dihydrodipicolinate synthase family protein [Acidiferrobacterales bacterium]|nr:dihydrodipicolinate synthase family protein [Acidiferrobacterales bacterium]